MKKQPRKLYREFESKLETVDEAERIVTDLAKELGFDEDAIMQLSLAVHESVLNAIVHGNRYDRAKKVTLNVETAADQIIVTVTDEGEGFDPEKVPDPLAPENLLKPSGRGLLLIRASVDEVELRRRQPRGMEVRMVKYRNPKSRPGG